MYTLRTYCRACDYGKPSGPPGIKAAPKNEKLVEVFDLGMQPPANDFCGEGEERAGFAPLKVLMCPRCLLAQLSVVVDPLVLYSKYSYVTSQTKMMFDHFNLLWDSIKERHDFPDNMLEIGSNDGTFLKFLQRTGVPSVLGIDPARNLADKAEQSGVKTLRGLFDVTTASSASADMPRVDVVIARHVFCHMDDWHGFIKNLSTVCRQDTLVVIEVPYVADLLNEVQFDTIYHEHLSYFNVKAMAALLYNTKFRLDHVQHVPIHAGAVLIYLRRRDYDGQPDISVDSYLADETENLTVQSWSVFEGKARSNIADLTHMVVDLTSNGKTVCGFGASAKSTVWINACGFTKKHLKFICDSTPEKQNKFSPGSDVPIVDEGALLRELPNYAILFAWNWAETVLKNNQRYIELGGRFIVPVPTIRIVPE